MLHFLLTSDIIHLESKFPV